MNAARRRPGGSTVRTRGRGPARPWVGWVSGVVVAALVVTLAVVASGFDSRETPREDPSVWAMRASGQYARINTETAEIDTVRQVQSPNAVVQSGGFGVVLTQGSSRAWPIDPAAPKDIGSGERRRRTAVSRATTKPRPMETPPQRRTKTPKTPGTP
ncbi:hypothetical protein [Leucobacter soli]|uniref:hypothetical protein n=1 Tax=Leucobacter soli TaxID=2812850 RepID=UPI00361F2E67